MAGQEYKIDLCSVGFPENDVEEEHKTLLAAATSGNGTTSTQGVSPAKLSQLLLSEGPLAIRFITKALCKQIPGFAELSASKQRRLIMAALETGDRASCVVFTKIGWGHWSATKVEDPANFDKEREATNIANSKVKDMVSQERRRSSTVSQAKKATVGLKREVELRGGGSGSGTGAGSGAVFLDENALASEDEEYEDNAGALAGRPDELYDDNDFHDHGHFNTVNYDFFKRRKSSVVYADSSPADDSEHEAPAGPHSGQRPPLKNNRRSSTSKKRSPSVGKRSSFRSSNASLEAITRRLSSPAHVIDQQTTKISGTAPTKDPEVAAVPTRGREPRLSFSKESGLRSTLLSHASYRSSPVHRAFDSPLHKDVAYRLNSPSSDTNALASFNGEDDGAAIEEDEDLDRSDTDEEDWKHIGAESLRNSRAPSQIRSPPQLLSPHSPAAGRPAMERQPSHLSLSPPALLDSPDAVPKSRTKTILKPEPQAETQDAAILLMSLKS
ncbi:LAME_0G11870g1_1 [Lachancea meyersii CBS 8951]|uniref:LAME_0G11870g1_1 n=1 Tax=Lachancea meyersii CBS 8951 TaxID=1266667 RepID=A0A1G4K9G5_9SACH|nr:LAME_0G11870g1_1 [Lachancea meyersii CBS 8951]